MAMRKAARAFRNVLLVLLFPATTVASDPETLTTSLAALQCPQSIVAWRGQLAHLKPLATTYVQASSVSQLNSQQEKGAAPVIFVTLIWPELLSEKLDYYRMYADCAEAHDRFLGDPTEANLNGWKVCNEHNYGREPLPAIYQRLASCYEGIVKMTKR